MSRTLCKIPQTTPKKKKNQPKHHQSKTEIDTLGLGARTAELPLVAMAGAGLEATGVVGSWRAETDGESSTDADGRGGAGR